LFPIETAYLGRENARWLDQQLFFLGLIGVAIKGSALHMPALRLDCVSGRRVAAEL
jgi:hypothetical protein